MAMAERSAQVVWNGTLARGNGVLTLHSGATRDLPVTWASRTERADGKTSPEELIAAAHATCFAMGLSHGLSEAGTPPDELNVQAACTLDATEAGPTIVAMALRVRGRVPGLDAGAFRAAAEQAKIGCPVSRALAPSVQVTVTAELD